MEYFAQHSPYLIDQEKGRQPLYHAYNGGEKIIENYRVDGYSPLVNGRPLFVEFIGCHWHGCVECGALARDESRKSDEEDSDFDDTDFCRRYQAEKRKYERLRSLGRLIFQRECQWLELKKTIHTLDTQMPMVWYRRQSHQQLLDGIRYGQLFGFVKCHVKSPSSLMNAVERGFFYPPIPTKIKLKPEYFTGTVPGDLPREPVLTQIYNTVEPILLHTAVVSFYLELGCEINIEWFIQYKGEKCFAPFVKQVVDLRMDAKRSGNEPKNITAKLCGNSSYGKCLENPDRYTNCLITSDQKQVHTKLMSPFYQSMRDLTVDEEVVEILYRSKKIDDSKPIQVGQCILQLAKLLLLRFVYWLDDHLEPGSFQLTYSDTDSIGIALTKTNLTQFNAAQSPDDKIKSIFGPIIKLDKKYSWQQTYTNWFVTDDTVENQLKPGLLKCMSTYTHLRTPTHIFFS